MISNINQEEEKMKIQIREKIGTFEDSDDKDSIP